MAIILDTGETNTLTLTQKKEVVYQDGQLTKIDPLRIPEKQLSSYSLSNKRGVDESFEDYKIRRRAINKGITRYLRGRPV